MNDFETLDLDQLTLGARLRDVRRNLGLHQVQVADLIGMARNSVWQIESGSRRVDSLELRKFAKLYGCSVNYLLCLEDPPDGVPSALSRVLNELPSRDQDDVLQFAQFLRHRREQTPGLRLVNRGGTPTPAADCEEPDWMWYEARRRRRNAR